MIGLWYLKIDIPCIFQELSDLFLIFFILLKKQREFKESSTEKGQLEDNK